MKTSLIVLLLACLMLTFSVPSIAQMNVWTREYDITPNGLPTDVSLEYPFNIIVAADGNLLIQGQFATSGTGPPSHPFLVKLDDNLNMEYARVYTPPSFLQKTIGLLPNGLVLIGGSHDYPWPISEYTPFIAAMDDFGGTVGYKIWPRADGADVSDVTPLTSPNGFAILMSQGGFDLRVKAFRANGTQLWTCPLLQDDSNACDIFQLPDGNIAVLTVPLSESTTMYIIDRATGAIMQQLDLDPPLYRYISSEMRDDGVLFIHNHESNADQIVRMEPPYDDYSTVVVGVDIQSFALTSDGGFIVSGDNAVEKYDADMALEWSVFAITMNTIVEYQPGVYAGSWTVFGGAEADLAVTFITPTPEPDRTPLDLYLYQQWNESFSIPGSGGMVEFTETVTNTWNTPVTVDRWTELHRPDGSITQGGVEQRTFQPGGYHFTEYSLPLAGTDPPGNYAYVVNYGTYPNDIMTSSSAIARKAVQGMEVDEFWPELTYQSEAYGATEPMFVAESTLPQTFSLGTPYPNPFNATTTVTLFLPETESVRVTLYDVLGREIRTLVDRVMPAGSHRLTIEADNLASGVYLLTAHSQSGVSVIRKLVLLK